ncbi:MAG: NAD(P)H-hydrate dehydratase [Spirochaetaceae bacterium]|nr:MAG: NAD(P)H-hydrate dehydratase [Spirochaetaceae bacterium]
MNDSGRTSLVDARLMSAIDRAAQERYHIPGLILMENAGARIWALLRDTVLPRGESTVLFIAGRGNNGGDALVMARHCAVEGVHRPLVVVSDLPLKEPGAQHLLSCRALGVAVHDWSVDREAVRAACTAADWIVDGITGTGISGPLTGSLAELVGVINACGSPVLSVDAPSGAGDGIQPDWPVVRARCTATVGLPKRVLYLPAVRPHCGQIHVVPIGFPPELVVHPDTTETVLDDAALANLLPAIDHSTYKTRRGVVSVFAGSVGMTGAAVLCSTAAAGAGAGLVRLFCDADIHPIVAGQMVSVMAVPLEPAVRTADTPGLDGERVSSLVVGPGWGRSNERDALLQAAMESGIAGVLDADGIRVLMRLREAGRVTGLGGRWVLTPHPGEFTALSGSDAETVAFDPASALVPLCEALDAVVVLKGHVTWIGDPTGRVTVVDGMVGELGTAGTGDVLAGVIGGLMARGIAPRDAAEAGVLLHAAAGRRLAAARGFFLAEHLLEEVSRGAAGVAGPTGGSTNSTGGTR